VTTPVTTAHERGVTTLTLDAPKRRNALSGALLSALTDALHAADGDDGTRAIVLTHTGGTFSAGVDLKDPSPSSQQSSSRGDPNPPGAFLSLLRLLLTLPTPVVARVTGHARAGGLGLLGACDIAVAGASATFAFTEVRIGVAPAVISLPLLPRLDPRAAARYFLTGEVFDAAEAARIGLLTAAAPDADTALAPVLDGLRRAAPGALRATKELVNAKVLDAFDSEGKAVTELTARLFTSEEATEGMTAFLERRDPSWTCAGTR
jgi:enoyl-CoA hydratase